MHLTQQDHARVTEAVAAAERDTDGEIVTVVAGRSDAYHDVALHWAVLAMLLVLALLSVWPGIAAALYERVFDPWTQGVHPSMLLLIALVLQTLAFLAVRLLLTLSSLRLVLTPGATKSRRVRRRAVSLFRTATEKRTRAQTGVLLYLSLAEHRAELIADAAIHERVAPEVWGEAMAALVAAVRDGRVADGMAEAVAQIGVVLAEHFPREGNAVNELPDRLIEL
ncbi:TPM domain-containing protein [Sphingomonas sp. ac-8]|uniref:TPM domain-containing protein n=1 Tax=Sphingomonas sp. ac-8 TaxID=3242977 RepID=UPI003A81365C